MRFETSHKKGGLCNSSVQRSVHAFNSSAQIIRKSPNEDVMLSRKAQVPQKSIPNIQNSIQLGEKRTEQKLKPNFNLFLDTFP